MCTFKCIMQKEYNILDIVANITVCICLNMISLFTSKHQQIWVIFEAFACAAKCYLITISNYKVLCCTWKVSPKSSSTSPSYSISCFRPPASSYNTRPSIHLIHVAKYPTFTFMYMLSYNTIKCTTTALAVKPVI